MCIFSAFLLVVTKDYKVGDEVETSIFLKSGILFYTFLQQTWALHIFQSYMLTFYQNKYVQKNSSILKIIHAIFSTSNK